MNKVIVLIIVFGGIAASTAAAQITITQSDYQLQDGVQYNATAYETSSTGALAGIVAMTGPNQTFDFTSISFTKSQQGQFTFVKLPADIPGSNDSDFASANGALVLNYTGSGGAFDSTAWVYEQVKSNGVYSAGLIYLSQLDFTGDGKVPDTLKFSYKPYQLEFKLPLTYQAAWKDTITQTISIPGLSSISEIAWESGVVDGYGTLKVQGKTEECLRYKIMSDLYMDNGGGSLSPIGTAGTIYFITKSGDLSASIRVDGSGNPISAIYTILDTATPIEKNPAGPVVKDYQLNQNYPNPFNPSTVISYDLRKAGLVKLDVYNYVGQHVATLVNSSQSEGIHKVTFNANWLNSGLYFYKLKAGNYTQIKKMMLIK